METINLFSVHTYRTVGIGAKWGKKNGKPCLFIRPSHSANYFLLSAGMLEAIQSGIEQGESVQNAVNGAYALCDIFNI